MTAFPITKLMTDTSISRYPEWEEYKAKSGLLLPWKCFAARLGVQ
jgi:hypothetical protein